MTDTTGTSVGLDTSKEAAGPAPPGSDAFDVAGAQKLQLAPCVFVKGENDLKSNGRLFVGLPSGISKREKFDEKGRQPKTKNSGSWN